MTEEQLIAEARQITGEANRPTRRQYPTIKFLSRGSQHGQAGTFSILRKAESGEGLDAKLIGDALKVTILKVRSAYDNRDTKPRKWIYEFDSPKDGLFLATEGQREPVLITLRELKEQHPELRFKQVLYVMYGGELCKLTVKGASLSNLWEYLDAF